MLYSLTELLQKVTSLKKGNNEFILVHVFGLWKAEIGNTSNTVNLGESTAEISSHWFTIPEKAVFQLIELLIEKQLNDD